MIAAEKQIVPDEKKDLEIFRHQFVLRDDILQNLLVETDTIATQKIKIMQKINEACDPSFDSNSVTLPEEISNQLEETDKGIFQLEEELEEIVWERSSKDDDVQKVFAKFFKNNTPSSERDGLFVDVSKISLETEVISLMYKTVSNKS